MKKPLRDYPLKWKDKHNIYSNDIEGEIWLTFENLSGVKYLESIIKKRVNSKYFKHLTNSVISNINDAKGAQQIQVLKDEDVSGIIDEAQNIILQAKDIYFAARSLPLLSKPILLFYCFEKLAELLYFMSYKKTKYRHGLEYDKQTHVITICKNGLFANLHNSQSTDPFYQNEPKIKLEDIIMCGPINQLELDTQAYYEFTHQVKTVNNDNTEMISLTELDREFIFLYGLSILARYNVKDWSRILSGIDNPLSNNIKVINHLRTYLRTVGLLYPNLILSEIYLMKLSIYFPMKLMSTEFEDYDDKVL